MKGIGPAGGPSMSRTLGTKVTLAGRTAFLPGTSGTGECFTPSSRQAQASASARA